MKPKTTYGEWISCLIKFITPSSSIDQCPKLVGMVNDTYLDCSTKSGTRKKRGEDFQKTFVTGFEQHMTSGTKWQQFLRNSENKKQLLGLISKYVLADKGNEIKVPFIITVGDENYKLKRTGEVESKTNCNHEEADSRIVLLALEANSDVVIVAKDTDILILLVWAYTKHNIDHTWYFKYGNEKYANIGTICAYFGEEICLSLPGFHAITGSDTTSYFYRIGKVSECLVFLATRF